jgi:hypothetical protein
MVNDEFDYSLHVFKSPEFESIVKKAVEFFIQTPVHLLPSPHRFSGPGVYGLYYLGDFELYSPIVERNRQEIAQPIYIGKAVAPGTRTARTRTGNSSTLLGRLNEHAHSILAATNLKIEDFRCRFMVLDGIERELIVPVESELIRTFKTVWNSCIDGFGIHDPGSGRYNQQHSEWDTLHPGRTWAEKLTGTPRDPNAIRAKVKQFLAEPSQEIEPH